MKMIVKMEIALYVCVAASLFWLALPTLHTWGL